MSDLIDEIVDEISNAHKTKKPIEFIRHRYSINEETSYLVQEKSVEKQSKLLNTEISGYKISMTSAQTQAIANTNEPAFGTLLSTHIINSGDSVSISKLFAPLIEPEIMFILTNDLPFEATEADIIENSKICAGIEIPDARYINWFPNFSLADLLCDNTATGLVVLSNPINSLSFKDFESIEMKLYHNGKKISEGISSAVLGNPVSSVGWLSKKLAERNKVLKKGMIISSGTFISPLTVKEGVYRATYSNVGEVKVNFVP